MAERVQNAFHVLIQQSLLMCPVDDVCKQTSILRYAQKEHQSCVQMIKQKLIFSVFRLL